MSDDALIVKPLGFPWQTDDPFLFCVHHDDAYPEGNEHLGPNASLDGRDIGQDFAGKDGWRMYHGEVVPGFPKHPHRGFETVTIARRGYIDHSDSLGAAARFGEGDTQWMTAGRGVSHSEMFPLLQPDSPNPVELFQIWLNLPSADKLVAPHFAMLWDHTVPRHNAVDASGRATQVTIIAGSLGEHRAPPPPPNSWAARPDTDVAIWTLKMDPKAQWTLPPAPKGVKRTLYFFRGASMKAGERTLPAKVSVKVPSERALVLTAGDEVCELLLLQGRPIGEPVAQHGPFVMNTRAEIVQAFTDYQRTQFGRWPWESDAPVHPKTQGRFARHADGRREEIK